MHGADSLHRKVGGAQRIDPDDAGAAQIATRVAVEHALVIDIFGAEYEMAPAPGERRAERDVHPLARSVATGRDTGMGTDRETHQILFERRSEERRVGKECGRTGRTR